MLALSSGRGRVSVGIRRNPAGAAVAEGFAVFEGDDERVGLADYHPMFRARPATSPVGDGGRVV